VGGADTDLISGEMLVDFKTTKQNEINVNDLDQLLGYLLLARQHHRVDPAFPQINRLGLYFCRHGYLWVRGATLWMDHHDFPEVERWFFERAKTLSPASVQSHVPVKRLQEAAMHGDAVSQYLLGRCYAEGHFGVAMDLIEARRWLEQAAAAGHAGARELLAKIE
jgi:TPR repeat protein